MESVFCDSSTAGYIVTIPSTGAMYVFAYMTGADRWHCDGFTRLGISFYTNLNVSKRF